MYHSFQNSYERWFNNYRVADAVLASSKGDLKPLNHKWSLQEIVNDDITALGIYFLVKYYGLSDYYNGWMVSDGSRYAYVVENASIYDGEGETAITPPQYRAVQELKEDKLNLYCRSLIREAIRDYLDQKEAWGSVQLCMGPRFNISNEKSFKFLDI